MSSFFLSSPSPSSAKSTRYSPSPARRALVTRQQTSPLQSRQERIERWQNEIKQRRLSNAIQARGGLEMMSAQYDQTQQANFLRELELQADLHPTRPEDEEFFQDNDYCHGSSSWQECDEPADESELLDKLLKEEEEELAYLAEQMSLQHLSSPESSDWDINMDDDFNPEIRIKSQTDEGSLNTKPIIK